MEDRSQVTGHRSQDGEERPLSSWKIKVENYYGPLDLLLHLVKEAEIDVTRVALAQVAQQYIHFIEAMQKLDIDLAGEFLTLASQLLLIKSRSVLPSDEELEEEEEGDTSLELIRRLLEYKIYKDRGQTLGRRAAEQSLKFPRPRMKLPAGEQEEEQLRDMEVWDLVVIWARLSKSITLGASLDILFHAIPIEVFIEKILGAMKDGGSVSFRDLVGDPRDKIQLIGTFLAVLELMKEQKVDAEQTDEGDIRIKLQ